MILPKMMKILALRIKSIRENPTATIEYPYVVKYPPQNARAGLRNNFAECIGCHKCEEVCPVGCIDIGSEDFPSKDKTPRTSHGVLFEKKVTSYKIDFNRCIQCGVCVEVCPTNSLTNDKNFIQPRQDSRHLAIDLVHRPRPLRKDQGYEE